LSYCTRKTDVSPARHKPCLPRHYSSMPTVTSHTDIERNVPMLEWRTAVSDRPVVSCRHTGEVSCLHFTLTVVCLPKVYDFKRHQYVFICTVITTFAAVSVLRSNESHQGWRNFLSSSSSVGPGG
jgi:hypothetical protein